MRVDHLPALFPEHGTVYGKITKHRLSRSFIAFGVICSLGFGLTQSGASDEWRTIGLGLMFPGGGFLSDAGWHFILGFGAAVSLFSASLVLWFTTGNALAPPLLWLGLAGLAPWVRYEPVSASSGWNLLILILLIVVAVVARLLWQQKSGPRWRRVANQYLADCIAELPYQQPASQQLPREFSASEVYALRFLLDRALQPVERYDGFEWLDQFQTAAVRYQLNFMGYALSMAQASRLPALGAYLDEAQRRLIQKQSDHRIWKYWALENLWGNLGMDPDPVARENIMFSGFCATQMAMFHAASGRRDFLVVGSFTLSHPSGRQFIYDYPALLEALENETRRSEFGLLACEPNWIYPLCNTIAASALKAGDAQLGGDRWSRYEARFRQALEEEFIDPSGRFIPCRSAYTGLALPVLGGAMPQAMPCFFLNATLPDFAVRQWLMLRRQLVEEQHQGIALRRKAFWPIDTGNYRFSRAAALAGTALAAVEFGDHEVAELSLTALDLECPVVDDGGRHYRPRASVWAHAAELFAISGQHNGFRDLIASPRTARVWPSIAEVSYPEVLVARAVHDAESLQATLYPGRGASRQCLGLSGLRSGGSYRCEGTEERQIRASAEGTSSVHVLLTGRREIKVLPNL